MKRLLCVALAVGCATLSCGEEQTTQSKRPPELILPGGQIVVEGDLLQFQVAAADPDGDPLYFEATQLPRGAAFDAEEGVLTWRPGFDQAGTYTVGFVVADGGHPSLSARGSVTISVGNYTEPIIAFNFPIEGAFADGKPDTALTARAAVLLDFSHETELSPTIAEMRVSNLPSMADASWQPFEPRVEWLLPPGDGPKVVSARFPAACRWPMTSPRSTTARPVPRSRWWAPSPTLAPSRWG